MNPHDRDELRKFWARIDFEEARALIQPNPDWSLPTEDVKKCIFDETVQLAVPSRQSALEIGCGMGRMLKAFAKDFDYVFGVDVTPEMIKHSETYLADTPNALALLSNGDTLQPIEDESIDFVFSVIVFQHLPSHNLVSSLIRDAHRVLKHNGVIRIQTHQGGPGNGVGFHGAFYLTIGAFAREFTAAGFRVLKTDEHLFDHQYLWVTAQKA